MNPFRPAGGRRLACFAASCLAAATLPLAAQTAPAPSRSTPAKEQETIVLSPFQVTTEGDIGYIATSTLAGSRMNSSLRDTPTAISVMTSEFLQDIGAISVNDVLDYGLNVAEAFDATGNASVENNFNFKIRGISGAQRARNYFRTQVNADLYNTERIDIARGPNSILFGEASPAGLINTSTKFARPGADFGSAQLRVASYDSRRASLDVNKSFGKTAALRVNLLKQDAEGYFDFERQDKEGMALAGTWRPFRGTQLRFEAERLDISENRARPWPAWDQYSAWTNAGSPLVGTPTQWGQFISNVNGRAGQNTMMYFSDGPLAGKVLFTGTVANASPENFRVSLGSITVPGLNTQVNTNDPSRHPRNGNLAGPSAASDSEATMGGVFLEQAIGEDLVVEVASGTEFEKRSWFNPILFSNLAVLYDTNAYLPQYDANGMQTGLVANPNAGKQLIMSNSSITNYEYFRQQWRATASYHLDFAKLFGEEKRLARWLGHHRMAGLYSTESFETERQGFIEANVSPTRVNTNILNSQNRITRVDYVDMFSANLADRGLRDFSAQRITNTPIVGNSLTAASVAGRTVDAQFVRNAWRWFRNDLDTLLFASHSYFWNDRLVALVGVRKDETEAYSYNQVSDPVTGVVTGFVRRQTPDRTESGRTSTRGLVFHATPWLSVFANRADNFAVQDLVPLFGNENEPVFVGNRKGEGKDAGFKLSLFDGRVSASLAWYETADANQLMFPNGVYAQYSERIWLALNTAKPAQFPEALLVDGRDTRSLVSEGYEIDLTANPTSQLRLAFNLKIAETTNSDLLPHVKAYLDANRETWMANASVPLTSTTGGVDTVGALVDVLDNQVLFDTSSEGQAPIRDREISANLTANYTFAHELLKGAGIGGSVQYRGDAVIGYRALTDNSPVYAPAFTTANVWLSYQRKLTEKIRLRLQLNVDNLFDFDDPQPVSSGQVLNANPRNPPTTDGIAYTYSLPLPRRYSLTATFSF